MTLKQYSKGRLTFSVLSFVSNLLRSTLESACNLYLLYTTKITGTYRWKKVTMMLVQIIGVYYVWSSMNE